VVGSLSTVLEDFQQLTHCLTAAGFDVVCFTNGAAEDEVFKNKLARILGRNTSMGEHVRFAPRSTTPRDLAMLIGSFDGVVAHRLHAVILAYAYGRPVIGLRWDGKLEAFLDSIDQSASLVRLDRRCGPVVRDGMLAQLDRGLNLSRHARVVQEAEEGVGALVADLTQRADRKTRVVA
jgi:hypothetical protein